MSSHIQDDAGSEGCGSASDENNEGDLLSSSSCHDEESFDHDVMLPLQKRTKDVKGKIRVHRQ